MEFNFARGSMPLVLLLTCALSACATTPAPRGTVPVGKYFDLRPGALVSFESGTDAGACSWKRGTPDDSEDALLAYTRQLLALNGVPMNPVPTEDGRYRRMEEGSPAECERAFGDFATSLKFKAGEEGVSLQLPNRYFAGIASPIKESRQTLAQRMNPYWILLLELGTKSKALCVRYADYNAMYRKLEAKYRELQECDL